MNLMQQRADATDRPDNRAPGDGAVPNISLRDLRKTFHRGTMAVEVLHGLALDIHAGQFVAIMGASGSGTSTLMHLIGLLDRPNSGSYRFDGAEVPDLGPVNIGTTSFRDRGCQYVYT